VAVRARDELGVLAHAYNTMTEQLAAHVAALQTAYRELQHQTQALAASLRKVELLEQIQTHLGKFVPAAVKRLIETAPEAPALEKQDRDVTVLFRRIAFARARFGPTFPTDCCWEKRPDQMVNSRKSARMARHECAGGTRCLPASADVL
jgi:hypothetical protein